MGKASRHPAFPRTPAPGKQNPVPAFHLARLRAAIKPFRLYWFPRLRSTNDHAAALRKKGKLFAPAILLTGRQIAGRGRGTNTWWSSKNVLTVTFALAIEDRLLPQELPLIAGLAVRNIAAALTGDHAIELKWPNDVLHEGRKLAGLLCERVNHVDLVGIGLNVNLDPADAPANLRQKITSLLAIGGKILDPNVVLSSLAGELGRMVRRRMEQPFSVFVREYQQHDALAGKMVKVIPSPPEAVISGRCEGIDSMGRLTVRARGTVHHVMAGNVLFDS